MRCYAQFSKHNINTHSHHCQKLETKFNADVKVMIGWSKHLLGVQHRNGHVTFLNVTALVGMDRTAAYISIRISESTLGCSPTRSAIVRDSAEDSGEEGPGYGVVRLPSLLCSLKLLSLTKQRGITGNPSFSPLRIWYMRFGTKLGRRRHYSGEILAFFLGIF